MARYEYDDFWVEFSPRAGGGYDVTARAPDGETATSQFVLPLTDDQLEQAVRTLGSTRAATTRDIGEVTEERRLTAEQLGGTLADALFSGQAGELYDAARSTAVANSRGVRLWLSLGETPGLLSVPWEFLYLQPTFLASQRKTPIVRFLRTDAPVAPRRIEKEVRILGVIASPKGLPELKVDVERQRVDKALEKARKDRDVTVDWLDPATPKALRLKLQERDYHILHFVGHSGYADDDESVDGGGGVIYLENENGSKAQVSDSQLVTLLGDQDSLRLVVLNSCEGARTSVRDPFAGIATSIVALGIPAVVAMQFEITDDAAIAFAEELYGSLIAREETIDVAVAEARKAVFTEVNQTEWATPVLFLRNEDGRLFDFAPILVATGLAALLASLRRSIRTVPAGWIAAAIIPIALIAFFLGGQVLGVFTPPPESPGPSPGSSTAEVTTAPSEPVRSEAPSEEPTPEATVELTPGPLPTVPGTGEWAGPRKKSNLLAAAGAESSTISHLGTVVPAAGADGRPAGTATNKPGVYDTDPTWIPTGATLAFTRTERKVTQIWYVVPGVGDRPDGATDKGIMVKDLIRGSPPDGVTEHAPAWLSDGGIIFARTAPCAPGRGCTETILASDLTWTGDFIASATEPVAVSSEWSDIRNIAQYPIAERVLVVGRNEQGGEADLGIWAVDANDQRTMLFGSSGVTYAVVGPDGQIIGLIGGTETGWGPTLVVWRSVDDVSPVYGDQARVLGSLAGTGQIPAAAETQFGWISASPTGDGYAVLITNLPEVSGGPRRPPVIGLLGSDFVLTDVIAPTAPTDLTWNELVALGW